MPGLSQAFSKGCVQEVERVPAGHRSILAESPWLSGKAGPEVHLLHDPHLDSFFLINGLVSELRNNYWIFLSVVFDTDRINM